MFYRILQKGLLSTIALIYIYGNCAVLLNFLFAVILGRQLPLFPVHYQLFDFFITFPVFTSYETVNTGFQIRGHLEGRDAEEWIDLKIEEYFPFPRGEVQARLYTGKFADNKGEDAQREARKFLARKIRERHNRNNPSQRIDRIKIEVEFWPRSKEGFFAEKRNNQVEGYEAFVEN